jgi:hypothetical protein
LVGINTPQTLKVEGYIKKKKVIGFIDFGSIHNFVNCKLSKLLNLFLYPVLEFQVTIVDGGTINFSRMCHSINLTIEEYLLDGPMISIQMGGFDVVLEVQ